VVNVEFAANTYETSTEQRFKAQLQVDEESLNKAEKRHRVLRGRKLP
jgi:hypothetical protein